MTHISNSLNGKNAWWRYGVMLVAVFLAINTIGAIPLFVGSIIKVAQDPEAVSRFANTSDPGQFGFGKNLSLFMLLFPFLIGLITFVLLIKPLHGRTYWQTMTGAVSYRWKRVITAAIVWTLFSASYLALCIWMDPASYKFNGVSRSFCWLILITFLFIPFQAALEETLFRGYLLQGFSLLGLRLRMTGGLLFPVIITSVGFGLLHSWNPEIKTFGFFTMIPQYVLMGILLGLATVFDDGTEIAVGAHAANNIFLCIFVTNNSSTLQTPALFEMLKVNPWLDFWALVISVILFLLIMKRIFSWTDFTLLYKSYPFRGSSNHTS